MTASSYGNLPKLSVIVVVRNAAGSIGRALDSLLAQHYPKLELVVWDGASNDGTQEVLARYAEHIHRLVSEQDNGPPDATNRASQLATGDYIGYLNADDEFEPGMLWAVAEAILHQPQAEVISTGILCRAADRGGRRRVIGYYAGEDQLALTLENVLSELPSFALSRFIRRELAAKVGLYNTNTDLWYISNDREWMARLALIPCRNVVIPRALYGFDVNSKSISNNPGAFTRIIDEHLLIADALLTRDDLTDAQRSTVQKWQNRQLALGFWRSGAMLQWSKTRDYGSRGLKSGGWHWAALCACLMFTKIYRKVGLMLSGGIDGGENR